MPDEKRIVECIECGSIMTAKTDTEGKRYLLGANGCTECGCKDFETVEPGDLGDTSETASG